MFTGLQQPPAVRRARPGSAAGLTLVEMMVVVAVVSLLATTAFLGVGRATQASRQSGVRFGVVNALGQARILAASRGTDVYVLFANVESTAVSSELTAPRLLVYEDRDLQLLGASDLMSVVNAAPDNIRFELSGQGRYWGESGLAFRDLPGTLVPPCDLSVLPAYLPVTGVRRTQRLCGGSSFCTFCERQGSSCVGAIRFSSDGTARIVTGGGGSGGLLRLVQPDDVNQGVCIAVGEPTGQAITLRRN